MRRDALAVLCRRRCALAALLLVLSAPSAVFAQCSKNLPPGAQPISRSGCEIPQLASPSSPGLSQLPDLTKKENFSSAMQIIILLTVLSLAPAILIMMTSFTRIIIVLSLLRQALGTQQLPPNQVLIGLSLFMTFLVMGPTWQRVNNEALQPYMNGSDGSARRARRARRCPSASSCSTRSRSSGNEEDIFLFHEFANRDQPQAQELKAEDVGTMTLVPAFMISGIEDGVPARLQGLPAVPHHRHGHLVRCSSAWA
jgi:flagellar biosynthetic protein FliP